MDLFCFASRNEENIWRGIEAKMWAVATVSPKAMQVRITKARSYLKVGSHGVLYCNPAHSFTTPFIVESEADPFRVVTDVWPEPWRLPFRIKPLGDPTKKVHMHQAYAQWPVLAGCTQPSISAAMNITGTTVFVPKQISDEDWAIILASLAS